MGRKICEVEEESKQRGGFRGRKEDEATLEDPVQEESDSKSESHVIKAFLTDGHSTKPLSCGKHLGPDGHVDAVFLLALFDSSFGYIHDVSLGDALCRSSCGAFCASTYQKKREKAGCSRNGALASTARQRPGYAPP